MGAEQFDDLTDVYEAMIDWPKRLAHEEPFYRRWFERVGVQSVVDVACGMGHHAALFHAWQLRVEGADLSPRMIEHAARRYGEPAGLHWRVRGFDQPIPGTSPFDAAICVGNSLTLAPSVATMERALGQMLAAVRPGGLLVVQILNLWRLPDGPCEWQKVRRTHLAQGEVLIIKGLHRSATRGYVELLVVSPSGGLLRNESVRFLGIEPLELQELARAAGAKEIALYGSYQENPYERHKSTDVVLVARK